VNAKTRHHMAILFPDLGPPRDERGRFTSGDAADAPPARVGPRAYDGGVRLSTPLPRDPAADHAALLLRLVAGRRARGDTWVT
jgi:hypothetical protein